MTQTAQTQTQPASTPASAANAANAAFVDSIPAAYDAYLGPNLFEFSAADLARRVVDGAEIPRRVLEVACGTGIATEHLWRALPAGSEIVATDLNQAMLDYAQRRRGRLDGVTWRQADAMALPYRDARFDAVVCQYGIMFFPDKDKGVAEMARVLGPGGKLTLNVWDSLANNSFAAIAHQTFEQFCPANPPQFLTVPFGDYDIEETRQRLTRAGLVDVRVEVVSELVRCRDLRSLALGLVEGTPGLLQLRAASLESTDTIVDALTRRFVAAFGPSPADVPMQEIVFTARKPA